MSYRKPSAEQKRSGNAEQDSSRVVKCSAGVEWPGNVCVPSYKRAGQDWQLLFAQGKLKRETCRGEGCVKERRAA